VTPPSPAAAELAKTSERSGQSGRAVAAPEPVAAPAEGAVAPAAERSVRRGRGRPADAPRATLRLDPNPY
jgi:hypothetical protein